MTELDGAGFHGSPELLNALGEIAFPRRRREVIVVAHEGRAYRVLAVDGRQLAAYNPFPLGLRALTAASAEGLPALTGPAFLYGDPEPIGPGIPLPIDAAPLVDWRGFESWEEYLRLGVPLGLIHTRPRLKKLAAAMGPVEIRVDDRTPGVIELALSWKSASARANGWLDVFSRPVTARLYREFQERGLQTFTTLRAGGRVVAATAGTRWQGETHYRFVANDPEFRRYSVGTALIQHEMELSCRAGDREFDFQMGAEAYKLRYATHFRRLTEVPATPVRKRAWALARVVPPAVRRPLRRAILRG